MTAKNWLPVTRSVRDASTKRRDRKLAFRMIADDAISVVTPQGAETSEEQDEWKQLVEEIRYAPVPALKQLRRLQPYTTNLHPSVLKQPGVMALLRPIL